MEDNTYNKKEKELLGHKRKEENDNEKNLEESYKKKIPKSEKEQKNQNIKEELIDQQQPINDIENKFIIKNEVKNEEKEKIEESENICEKCGVKKKTLIIKNIDNVLKYLIKENINIPEIKDLLEKNKYIQFNNHKLICEECLKNLINDKNNFENYFMTLNLNNISKDINITIDKNINEINNNNVNNTSDNQKLNINDNNNLINNKNEKIQNNITIHHEIVPPKNNSPSVYS